MAGYIEIADREFEQLRKEVAESIVDKRVNLYNMLASYAKWMSAACFWAKKKFGGV